MMCYIICNRKTFGGERKMEKVEKIKKEFIKPGFEKEEIEEAFKEEYIPAFLAGTINRELRRKKREKDNELLRELGPDNFEIEYQKRFGKMINTAENARKFWGR